MVETNHAVGATLYSLFRTFTAAKFIITYTHIHTHTQTTQLHSLYLHRRQLLIVRAFPHIPTSQNMAYYLCVISGLRREVNENCALLAYYAASGRIFLPTLRVNLSVPPSNYRNCVNKSCAITALFWIITLREVVGFWWRDPAGWPETSVRNYHYTLRNSLVECSFGVRFVNTIHAIWNNTPSCRAPHNY